MTTALLTKINNTNFLFAGLKLNSCALVHPKVAITRHCPFICRSFQTLFVARPSILYQKNQLQQTTLPTITTNRTHFTFNFPKNVIRYRRSTRPKKSNKDDILLNYEQAQFIENLGVTKSWNSWNTC